MPKFYDQLNRAVTLSYIPNRIISLVPSQTELLFELGLDTKVVGITSFCIHPQEKVKHVARIGGTKQLNIPRIHQLHPDIIIANKEENQQNQVEELMSSFPVWISDVNDLASALDMIKGVGDLTDRKIEAATLTGNISRQFASIKPISSTIAVYLIWRKPYMAAGRDTFINAMLQCCGFSNAIDVNRYPEVTIDELIAIRPDMLLLSSEPYPFKQKHMIDLEKMLPDTKIILVDGEMFSWYGSRLKYAPAYFNTLINTLQ